MRVGKVRYDKQCYFQSNRCLKQIARHKYNPRKRERYIKLGKQPLLNCKAYALDKILTREYEALKAEATSRR